MKGFSVGQRKLIADYLAQIGVAWFAVGVISVFIGEKKTIIDTVASISWGLGFSASFLGAGTSLLKGTS